MNSDIDIKIQFAIDAVLLLWWWINQGFVAMKT
jgi:hypothetical protein